MWTLGTSISASGSSLASRWWLLRALDFTQWWHQLRYGQCVLSCSSFSIFVGSLGDFRPTDFLPSSLSPASLSLSSSSFISLSSCLSPVSPLWLKLSPSCIFSRTAAFFKALTGSSVLLLSFFSVTPSGNSPTESLTIGRCGHALLLAAKNPHQASFCGRPTFSSSTCLPIAGAMFSLHLLCLR